MALSRRQFLAQSALAAGSLPALGSALRRPFGANDRLRAAVIGVKGRGGAHMGYLMKNPDVEIVALCDVDPREVVGPSANIEKKYGRKPVHYTDARKLMEDKSVDLITVATTNHTHSLFTIWGLQAGKHVYVEKPMSHNIFEGQRVVEAQKKYGKVVQHGTQSRSMSGMRAAIQFLRDGKLGPVKIARGFCYKQRKSIGSFADEAAPPAGVDYDLWLGPAPERPFNKNRFHYNWHWYWDYGNGDIGNQGVHEMDKARWGIGKMELPNSCTSVGGRLGYKDGADTPNTQIGIFDYGDVQLIFEVRGLDTDPYKAVADKAGHVKIGNIFECAEGTLVAPTYSSAVAFNPKGEVIQKFGGGDDGAHMRNFLDAIKSNQPEAVNAPALDGHLSSALCHLMNISFRVGGPKPLATEKAFEKSDLGNEAFGRMKEHLKDNQVDLGATNYVQGRTIKIDPKAEAIVDDPEAAKLMRREYRKGFEVPEKP
jgi:predicted dehydrogenase